MENKIKVKNSTTSVPVNVLIVEDDEPCYIYLREIFEQEGIHFCHVSSGLDAVHIIGENPDINLILMDIIVPGINGLEATRRIKKIRPEIPIIIQSAYSNPDYMVKAFEAGCTDYITKPFSINTLLEKIMQNTKNRK